MTRNQLIERIRRVRGLTLFDPWGTRARVDRLDGDYVWLWYDGLDVPFRRSLDSLVEAANGHFKSDSRGQFGKRFKPPWGGVVTLEYEPNWVPKARPSLATPRPTLESLRGVRLKMGKRSKT